MSLPADRNVDGILNHMRDYLKSREQQIIRMNPRFEHVIGDIIWIHLEILKHVLQRQKAFGGEKFRVADVLSGFDDLKRRALLSTSDQNSIQDEIINRSDEMSGKKSADQIHDMRTFYRSIDPELEHLAQLIQHWIKWDLPDAADLHSFDEQSRRLAALRSLQFTDDIKSRYRHALGKPVDAPITEQEILAMEMGRLDQVASRFCSRRSEDEPYQLIIRREPSGEGENATWGEPYDYKLKQCHAVAQKLEEDRKAIEDKQNPGGASSPEAPIELQA